MRIITEQTSFGRWTAWIEDAPLNGYDGATPQTAIARLCGVIGRHPNGFRFTPSRSRPHRFVLDELRGGLCPDCG